MLNAIKFCHISPTAFLKYTKTNGAHLILAHLVEDDEEYSHYYRYLNDGAYKIMDNSAFEMFKLGRPMYDEHKLLTMAGECKADCIVMSDYPKQPYTVTVEAAKRLAPKFKDVGYDTFFVPQSELGDMDGLLRSIEWGLNSPEIDLIGLSILSCPIACGVDETTFDGGKRNDAYKMQRFMSRWKIFHEMDKRDLLTFQAQKRFHCLGMVDGPNEISLLRDYQDYIFSWDSSAAVWAGMNGISFDNSPTGLMNGKFEKEVDFKSYNEHNSTLVLQNIEYINNLLRQ